MVSSVSIEVSSRCDIEKAHRIYSELGAARIFVTWRPDEAIKQFRETCVKLSEVGLKVVPHMVARNLRSANEFQELLYQFNQYPGINSLMLLSGDANVAAGPYQSAMDLLADDNLQSIRIKKIFAAGYPQGHALISQRELDSSLLQKVDCTRRLNLKLEIVTQLCVSITDSVNWALATKARHNIDVRISVPVGEKNIVERRLKQIYQVPIALKSANNHDVKALAYLDSACKKLQSENTQLNLHLIPFHNMDTLLSYTKEINTMLKSKLS